MKRVTSNIKEKKRVRSNTSAAIIAQTLDFFSLQLRKETDLVRQCVVKDLEK